MYKWPFIKYILLLVGQREIISNKWCLPLSLKLMLKSLAKDRHIGREKAQSAHGLGLPHSWETLSVLIKHSQALKGVFYSQQTEITVGN